MKRSLLFTAVLCGMLTAASAMAGDARTDFHALSAMSSPVPVMTETQMASVEGGQLSDLLSLVASLLAGLGL
jgi:hypothetical protein